MSWGSWQRGEDYYMEGLLIWLDADTKIRELSSGKKSLDDFAKLFFGVDNGSYVTRTYDFDEIVKALNTVQPYDWGAFLRERVDDLAPKPPENGIAQGGYRLVYNDTEPDWMKHEQSPRGTSFATSLGFSVQADGILVNVSWDSPAFRAGITPDMQIEGVNDHAFSLANLREAILAAESAHEAIKLLAKRDEQFVTVTLDYHGGMRYPHLERVEGTPDRLGEILAPGQ